MSEWKEYKLGDIITMSYGKALKEQDRIQGDIPVYSSAGITGYHNQATIDSQGIIIGRKGTIGKIYFSNMPFCCIDTAYYILPNEKKYDFKFIFYLLQTLGLQELNEDSAVPGLNRETAYGQSISLPPLPEQHQIASILSGLDDKIDLLHRQNKTLEQLAEALFRQWFVEEAEESWAVTILEKHTEVFRGLSYKGSGLTENGLGLPMHNLNSVYEGGGYKYEGIKFYKGDYKERHLINVGDIIVTNTEQGHEFKLIGFPAIVPDCFGSTGLFSQHIYKLTPLKQTYLTREFIYYLLMTSSVREQIIGATNGSTVNMLAIDGLQRPEFKLPPKEKVILFTTIVKDYWIKKNVNQNQINTLTKLHNTLLPKLMSGGVRVEMN